MNWTQIIVYTLTTIVSFGFYIYYWNIVNSKIDRLNDTLNKFLYLHNKNEDENETKE